MIYDVKRSTKIDGIGPFKTISMGLICKLTKLIGAPSKCIIL